MDINKREKLFAIIPAYNEHHTVKQVAREWHKVIEEISPESRLVIIDDGSKDDTYKILCELKKELPQLEPITKPNGGHGATILFGYKYALSNGAEFIFQTDSDGQTLPEEFNEFWRQRNNFDVLIGHRKNRQDGISRVFVTKVLKLVLYCTFHVSITDANTPYRLMKREILQKYIYKIPADYNLTNVLLSVLFTKGKEKIKYIPITFKPRQGGENSINLVKISKIGIQAVKDFKVFRRIK